MRARILFYILNQLISDSYLAYITDQLKKTKRIKTTLHEKKLQSL
jgi:hypothetical protein